jgi:hypothetical protein
VAFKFEFNGGIFKPATHRQEKFLLFFVVGGKEVPLFQMVQTGLVYPEDDLTNRYTTGNNLLKVFIMEQGFGVRKRFHSFYVRLVEGPFPEVTIRPFSGKLSNYFFRGKVRFLKEKQVLQILDEESPSRRFVARQSPLPKKVMKEVIEVDRSAAKEGVRHVRIGRKNGD